MVDIRRQNMFSKLTLFYNDNPLCLVRGEGQYIFDEEGRRWVPEIPALSQLSAW
jgi:acetylornithine/succinyldiaminopimelate/putrescine aminotransferase